MPTDIFDHMVEGFRDAFSEVRDVAGHASDPAVAKYEKLDKAGFDKLREQYGLDALATYIRRMEARSKGVK